MLSLISSLLLSVFSYSCYVAAQNLGTITAPVPGTHIAPGAAFNFSYVIRADYCTSSYAYAVYLITSTPNSFAPSDEFMTGYFFGRFEGENYPGTCLSQTRSFSKVAEGLLAFFNSRTLPAESCPTSADHA